MLYEEHEGTAGKTRIPVDVDAWQLYDLPGADVAAAELTTALKAAMTAPKQADAARIMLTALRVAFEFGAMDTEPRGIAERCLSKARGSGFELRVW